MRLLSALPLLLLLPVAAQAQFMPRTPPPGDRMPGISDMGTLSAEPSIGRDLRRARDLISQGREDGDLSKREARALRREARQIDTLAERYGRDGLSESEQRELDMRVQVLRAQTIAQRSSGK
jgi:hypothetical protein